MRSGSERKTKVCFLSLYSYPLFNPACISPFGGSEVRVALIAKELAKYPDLDLHIVVFDHGQPLQEVRHGVTLHSWPRRHCPLRADDLWAGANPTKDRESGAYWSPLPQSLWMRARLQIKAHSPHAVTELVRRLRYPASIVESTVRRLKARLRGEALFGAIKSHAIRSEDIKVFDDIGADVYVAHGNHDLTANLVFYCRNRNKKYVMLTGSDQDIIAAHNARSRSTDTYGQLGFLMVYTIENADLVLVQTRRQAELAKTYFDRDAIVIPNPIELLPKLQKSPGTPRILWIGKSDDRVKQPQFFLDLARAQPEYQFVMVMSRAIDSVHRHILQTGRGLPNLEIVTYVPHEEVEKYFAEAALLVNTSVFEGFPDTFLQAAKYGVPIVSLSADPDGMLAEQGCGLACGGDFGKLVKHVSQLMSHEQQRRETGARGRQYVARRHDKNEIIPRYRDAIGKLRDGG